MRLPSTSCWMREESEILDKLPAGFLSALDSENDHAARTVGQVFLRQFVGGVAFERRMAHPFDLVMVLEVLGHGQPVFGMALHAQRKGFDALQG